MMFPLRTVSSVPANAPTPAWKPSNGGERKPLSALAGVLLTGALSSGWMGCGDWPHFDYAEVEPITVVEVEGQDKEVAQNLHRIYGEVGIQGQVSRTGYELEDGFEAPFELDGWYSGDIDWYQFVVWEQLTDVDMSLTWEMADAHLDLYFCVTGADGDLSLVDYREEQASGFHLPVDGLDAYTIYVLAVAGRDGQPSNYQLSLKFNTL